MSWADSRLCMFDLETTGTDPFEARIVSAAIVFAGGQEETFINSFVINPEAEISAEASQIHGINSEIAGSEGLAPRLAVEAVSYILRINGAASAERLRPVVIYNAAYDMTVMDCELKRHGFAALGWIGPIIDPLVIDKHCDRYRSGSRKLVDVCQHYGVKAGRAHRAEADALMAGRLAYKIAQKYPQKIKNESPAELHRLQGIWARDQQKSLQEHFRKEGKDEVVLRGWPILQKG